MVSSSADTVGGATWVATWAMARGASQGTRPGAAADPTPAPAQFAGQGSSIGERQLDLHVAIASRHGQHRTSLGLIWLGSHDFPLVDPVQRRPRPQYVRWAAGTGFAHRYT